MENEMQYAYQAWEVYAKFVSETEGLWTVGIHLSQDKRY